MRCRKFFGSGAQCKDNALTDHTKCLFHYVYHRVRGYWVRRDEIESGHNLEKRRMGVCRKQSCYERTEAGNDFYCPHHRVMVTAGNSRFRIRRQVARDQARGWRLVKEAV